MRALARLEERLEEAKKEEPPTLRQKTTRRPHLRLQPLTLLPNAAIPLMPGLV